MEIILGLLTCFIIFLLWLRHRIKKDKHFYDTIPGPPTVPVLGNALDFTTTTELLNTLTKYSQEYGEIVKVQLGPFNKFILISDVKFLEFIFNSAKLLKKSEDYQFVESWLGTGLLTGHGPKWKLHRRILTPAFHFQMLETFIEGFETCGQRLIEKLEKEVGKDRVEIHGYITLCTLDIICESTMGIKIDAQNNDNSDYVKSVKNMCRIVIERTMSLVEMNDFLYHFTRNYFTERKAIRILHGQANKVITEKRKALETKNTTENNEDDEYKPRKAFLDLLLEARVNGQPLTQEEIREEVDTFMFAGHDTTAAAISFTLFCLANHREVQEKVVQEQKHIFENNASTFVTYGDLQQMKYLEMVIKESLRLYPPVPLYCRESNSEAEYENKKMPDKDSLVIFTYGIHRNPKYFNDPETFDPSRFENMDFISPYVYIPFSAGSRNCIGQKFAMLEMKCIISKIVRRFELHPAIPEHRLKLAAETVLTSVNGVKIGIKSRKS